jgi:hypothetical protein
VPRHAPASMPAKKEAAFGGRVFDYAAPGLPALRG